MDRIGTARAKYPDATFVVERPIPDVEIAADELAIFCHRNVVRNSIQHGDVDAPEVRVDVERYEEWARVHIADNGAGVPKDVERFVFGEGVSSLDGDGHGAGLFLPRKVVEDLYGRGDTHRGERPRRAEFAVELPIADR